MRMGAWAHALTYAAFAACGLMLRGGGRTADRRANALHRVSRRVPEAAIAGLTACIVIVFASIAVAGPNVDVSFLRAHDGLGWVPAGLRADVDGLRDEIVTNELDAATERLSGDQVKLWTATYTAANAVDDPDVARLTADPAPRARPGRDRRGGARRAQPSRVRGSRSSRSQSVTRSCSPSTGAACRATSRSPTPPSSARTPPGRPTG